jgi:endonuclease YncB( thermonuclease family)
MGNRRAASIGVLFLLSAVGLCACTTPPASKPAADVPVVDNQESVLVGTVIKITDGDTIHVQLSSGPITVRFDSIDAPEHDQPWGAEASAALAARISGREVALSVVSQDRYERLVAVVYLGDENINAWMVQQGHAWAYRQYLDDRDYCVREGIARATDRGLWALPPGSRHAPWEWRSAERGKPHRFSDYANETVAHCIASMHRPPPKCRIKGNISDNGKIYHVPGGRWYDETTIDPSKGERWFCTEEEARAAGWRAAMW